MKQSGFSCILRDRTVGNSSVPTKVSKNISTDLQEADGKETKGPKEVQSGKKFHAHVF